MIKVWILRTDSMGDPLGQHDWEKRMTKERWEHIKKLPRPKDRIQSAAAGFLLSHALKDCGISDVSRGFYRGEDGKPFRKDICFNLSHSRNRIVCVVSDRPVGCDVQSIVSESDHFLSRFYSEEERTYVCRAESRKERARRFTRIWTLRESYAKMTGEGIVKTMGRISIRMGQPVRVYDRGILQPVKMFLCEQNDAVIAVCGSEMPEMLFETIWTKL